MPLPVPLEIGVDDPTHGDVRALLATHLTFSRDVTPPEHVFALDADGLSDPAVTFFSARSGGELVGIGALKRLDAAHVELKSMHTRADARRRGVGRAMVRHLLGVARVAGYRRVSPRLLLRTRMPPLSLCPLNTRTTAWTPSHPGPAESG